MGHTSNTRLLNSPVKRFESHIFSINFLCTHTHKLSKNLFLLLISASRCLSITNLPVHGGSTQNVSFSFAEQSLITKKFLSFNRMVFTICCFKALYCFSDHWNPWWMQSQKIFILYFPKVLDTLYE